MKKKEVKKEDIGYLAIPAFLLIGIGAGMLLKGIFPSAIPAFTLVGLGVGMIISFLIQLRRR